MTTPASNNNNADNQTTPTIKQRLQFGGHDIFLTDRGSGPPILFLHGNPDSSALWHDITDHLAKDYRCLAPDLPGFGQSQPAPDFDCSLESMATFVQSLLEELEVQQPVRLVVHDFGGPFGLSWAIRQPQRVHQIAVINSLYSSSYRWHFWARIWRTPALGELSMLAMNRWLFHWELRRGSRNLSRRHIRETYAGDSPRLRRMVLQLYRATDPQNFHGWEEQLQGLAKRIPVRVLWGTHDPYIPTAIAKTFGTEDIHLFDNSGHWLPAEQPDAVAENLKVFFG